MHRNSLETFRIVTRGIAFVLVGRRASDLPVPGIITLFMSASNVMFGAVPADLTAFARLAALYKKDDGTPPKKTVGSAVGLVALNIARSQTAGGSLVNLSIVRGSASSAAVPAKPAPAVTTPTATPAAALASGEEDPATNAALLAMLSQKLGAPNSGRWGTSTHVACRTSEESAAVRGATLASGAKAMLLSTKPSDTFVLAVISASAKMDSKAFKKVGGFKSTKFASEEEVFALTGCRPGAVPPFGSLWGVRTLVDQSLLDQGDSINFNSGLKTASVNMSTADFLEVEQPVVASFGGA